MSNSTLAMHVLYSFGRIRRKDPESKFAGLPLPPIISCSKPCQPDKLESDKFHQIPIVLVWDSFVGHCMFWVTLKHESHGLQAVQKLRKQLGGVTFLQGKKVGF